ncbi:hypothetical protein ACX8XN_08345 [Calditrichota bacterium GD2]
MNKKFILFIYVFLLLSINLEAKNINFSLKPSLGSFNPESNILKDYYNQDLIFIYGLEFDILTNFHNLGAYFKINRFSVSIEDKIQTKLKETSIWYDIGIMKRLYLRLLYIDFKSGLTIHNDNLSLPFSDALHYGYEFAISIGKIISDRVSVFIEFDYNYENRDIPYYVNEQYSRRQIYLSGKNFSTGGYILQTGLSLSLH